MPCRATIANVDYHVREAVQNPNGRHQIEVDLPNQPLLFICLFFEWRADELEIRVLMQHNGLAMERILLGVGGSEVTNVLYFCLPCISIGAMGCHPAKRG